jgi:hypothetical protein
MRANKCFHKIRREELNKMESFSRWKLSATACIVKSIIKQLEAAQVLHIGISVGIID